MYTRIGTFDADPARLDEVVGLFRGRVYEAFSAHEGFFGYDSCVDRSRGRMVGLSYWRTRADLEASAPAALAARQGAAALGAATVGEPQILELAFARRRATLHFLCGKAGAGKSTIARDLAAREGAVLVSEDVWLARLYGDRMRTFDDYRAFAGRLKTVVGPLVTDLLAAGQSVVLDFPANTRASRAWLRSLFEGAGSAHTLHYVDVPDATCLQRIGKRNAERPEGSHHLSDEDFAYISSFFEAPQESEGFHVRLHVPASA